MGLHAGEPAASRSARAAAKAAIETAHNRLRLMLSHVVPDQPMLGVRDRLDSERALESARKDAGVHMQHVAVDAAEYTPAGSFKATIFNQWLEYFADPIGLMRRYEHYLAHEGVFVPSVFVGVNDMRHEKTWKGIGAAYQTIAHTRVSTRPKLTWTMKVLKPPSRAERQAGAQEL